MESNHVRGDQSWVQFVRRAKAPELPVVLLEDLGALVGLVLALFGVGLTLITDDGIWDGIGTVCIGVLLVVIAVVLAIETKSLLLGEGADAGGRAPRSRPRCSPTTSVERVIHMRTLHLGPRSCWSPPRSRCAHDDTAADVARAIDAAEARIRAAVPIARVIYLEPDLLRRRHRPRRDDRPPVDPVDWADRVWRH